MSLDILQAVLQMPEQQDRLVLAVTSHCTLGIALASRRVYEISVALKGKVRWLEEQSGICLLHEVGPNATEEVIQTKKSYKLRSSSWLCNSIPLSMGRTCK